MSGAIPLPFVHAPAPGASSASTPFDTRADTLVGGATPRPAAAPFDTQAQTIAGGPTPRPQADAFDTRGDTIPGGATPRPAPNPPPPADEGAPADGDPLALEVGVARDDPTKRFGRFVILSELGRGGMGVVHRAWDTKLRRLAAVKTVLAGEVDEESLKRFGREAEAVARLRHPNVIAIHETGVLEGKHFIAMDFIDGAPLDRRIGVGHGGQSIAPKRPGKQGPKVAERIALTKALEVMRDVSRAVHHAHEQGVIHRDLKPQNIMLDKKDHPYVMDFGLARVASARTKLTRDGKAGMGTLAYMPPEQADGGAVDARADVWALGATLYHVLCGRPPFEGASEVNVLAALMTKDPVPPGAINPRLAGDLETICLRCLEKDPARRYPTAAALADDLDAHLRGDPIAARPIGRAERLVRLARRNKVQALLAVALVASVVAGAGLAVQQRLEYVGKVEAERNRAVDAEADAKRKFEEAEAARKIADEKTKVADEKTKEAQAAAAAERDAKQRAEVDRQAAVEAERVTKVALTEARVRLTQVWLTRAEQALERGDRGSGALFAAGALLSTKRLEPGTGDELASSAACTLAIARSGLWAQPLAPRRALRCVSWSSAGLAGGRTDGLIDVRDAQGNLQKTLETGRAGEPVRALAWSRDGQLAVIVGPDGDGARRALLLFARGSTHAEPVAPPNRWWQVAWSGAEVAACTEDGRVLLFTPGGAIRELPPPGTRARGALHALAFSPDGELLACAGRTQDVLFYRLSDLTFMDSLNPHRMEVWDGAWSKDGRWLVTVGGTNAVAWHLTDRGLESAALPHDGVVYGVSWRPDGRRFATASVDGTVRIWSPGAKEPEETLRGGKAIDVAWSPDGRTLVSLGEDGLASRWAPEAEATSETVVACPHEVGAVAFDRLGERLLVGCDDGRVRIVKPRDGALLEWDGPITPRTEDPSFSPDVVGRITAVAWLDEDRTVAASTWQRQTWEWPTPTGVEAPQADARRRGTAVAVSGDGRVAALAPWSNTAVILERGVTAREVELGAQGQAGAHIFQLALSPDGRLLATRASDRSFALWDVVGKKKLHQLDLGPCGPMAFSPDGKLLAAVVNGGVQFLDPLTCKETSTTAVPAQPRGIEAIAWRPEKADRRPMLATGGADRKVRLWEPGKTLPSAVLPGHGETVRSLSWTPDGALLASGSADHTVRLWRLDALLRRDIALEAIVKQVELATGLRLDQDAIDVVRQDGR